MCRQEDLWEAQRHCPSPLHPSFQGLGACLVTGGEGASQGMPPGSCCFGGIALITFETRHCPHIAGCYLLALSHQALGPEGTLSILFSVTKGSPACTFERPYSQIASTSSPTLPVALSLEVLAPSTPSGKLYPSSHLPLSLALPIVLSPLHHHPP